MAGKYDDLPADMRKKKAQEDNDPVLQAHRRRSMREATHVDIMGPVKGDLPEETVMSTPEAEVRSHPDFEHEEPITHREEVRRPGRPRKQDDTKLEDGDE